MTCAKSQIPQTRMIVGSETLKLDAQRRLRMPEHWSNDGPQAWLLFPRHVLLPCQPQPGWLFLVPADEGSLRRILPAAPDGALSVETTLSMLRANARRHALDPFVATAFRIRPTQPRFALTKAQTDWLGLRDRTVFVCGLISTANVCNPAKWAEMEASVFNGNGAPRKRMPGSAAPRRASRRA